VLAGLALYLAGLVVALCDRGDEITVGGDHEKTDVCLRRTRNHVLNEISMAGSINDGIVVGVGEKLLSRASNGDTASALLLRLVHVESKSK
jgi:hypothetical protein